MIARRRPSGADLLHLGLRAALAGVFLWSGVAKALDRQGAVLAVDAYELLPARAVEVVAAILPWAEIGIGALLLVGLAVRPAAAGAAGLLAAFLGAMAQAKARGLRIDCGCFGGGGPGEGVRWTDLGRDALLLGSAVVLALRPRGPLRLDRYLEGGDDGDREGPPGSAVEG
ncbi:MAG TPA: DoxX family protein [Actinomycetota bacterium]|nr:DoxX family protein [Actinomycetota bacterium]